ncbi:MAG: hypothetical protein JXL84_04065 [Deltaproteobacteria bacterium]|nr:hypothetical protein [Deltaproteobacteria bacterium]
MAEIYALPDAFVPHQGIVCRVASIVREEACLSGKILRSLNTCSRVV